MTTDRARALAERALNDARLCRRQAQAVVDEATLLGWHGRGDTSPPDLVRELTGRGLHCLRLLDPESARAALRDRHPHLDELLEDLDGQLRALALTAEANSTAAPGPDRPDSGRRLRG